MIKIIGLLLVSFIALSANAKEYTYQSLGQPNITFDLENKVYMIGDAEGELKSCQFIGLSLCFQMGENFIVIPNNHKAPLKIQLSKTLELVFLPISKSLSMLGNTIDGFEVHIHNLKDETVDSSLFFNNELGILMLSVDGNTFWSSSIRGMASNVKS
jgi:hypothetical protein